MKNFLLIFLTLFVIKTAFSEIEVNTNYAGANAKVLKIEDNEIYLKQELRDTKGWWFYWNFELKNVANKEITVHFTDGDVIEANGPAYSLDGGKSWQWLGASSVKRQKDFKNVSFTHKVPNTANSVRYCLSFPYQRADFDTYTQPLKTSQRKNFKEDNLAITERGRQNIYATFGNPNGKYKIALSARHHSCESIASYTLEGFIDEVMCDSQTGKWLAENVEFFIIPFVDLDGVEDGDQGKNRTPNDHNRDYYGTPNYASIKSIKEILPKWGANKLNMILDLHCPWIGNRSEKENEQRRLFFVHGPEQDNQCKNLENLSKIFEDITIRTKGAILHLKAEDVLHGQSWNNLKIPATFKGWGSTLNSIEISTTLEISYSDVRGLQITDSSARNIGRNLAHAVKEYLQKR